MRKRYVLPIAIIAALSMGLAGCGQSSTDTSTAKATTASETTEYQGNDLTNPTYDDIIAEYTNVIQSLNNGASLEDVYDGNPDVAFDSFGEYYECDEKLQEKFFYAKTDLNGDGSDELVLSILYPEAESEDEKSVIGLFAQDKDGVAHSLLTGTGLSVQSAFAYEILVDTYADNRFTINEEVCDEGFYIFNIADDGYTPKLEAHYDCKYDEEGDSTNYVDSDGNEITGDEMNEMLGTPNQNLSWTQMN